MTLTVNNVDMTPYIAAKNGVKWSRNDLESPSAGRTLDGLMHRGRVGTKIRMDITCRPLKASELHTVQAVLYPEYLTVTYYDPLAGGNVTKTMYTNNLPAGFLMRKPDGTEWWDGVTFPLIER